MRRGEEWRGEKRGEREVNGEEGKEIRSMVDNKPVLCVLIVILILLQWCQFNSMVQRGDLLITGDINIH